MQLNISFNKFKYTCKTILHIKKKQNKNKTNKTHTQQQKPLKNQQPQTVCKTNKS